MLGASVPSPGGPPGLGEAVGAEAPAHHAPGTRSPVAAAVAACENKKADRLTVLELEKNSGAFTDYFVICSASNPRQLQAISDEVEERLK